jgi:5,10-methylene-tetrahydrofolate dehydrogenase/methenyl tetrahydrofolate cyclohydrolase
MPATVIDGKAVAQRVRAEVGQGVAEFTERYGRPPGLATVLVGEDSASAIYVSGKQKATAEVGMRGFDHRLPADAPREEVVGLVESLNADPEVSGIICQLPVPDHLDGVELTSLVDPGKTTCHSRTRDLPAVCRRADVLIAAVGRDRMVKGDWVKPGATVIDVGMNRSDDGLHGDVAFDEAVDVAGAITPVPGGVGPMTIACLLRNTLQAATIAAG